MQEQSIMEMVKWVTGFMLMFLIIAVGIFVYDISEIPTMKQQVNYQIERQGGLTNKAQENIDKYAKANFKGKYTLKSNTLGQKVDFGEMVDYTIEAKFKPMFFNLPPVNLEFSGSGVSQIR